MGTTKPIKNLAEIESIKKYYLDNNKIRDYALFSVCINTALRISDVLNLKWENVFNFQTNKFYSHITIKEQKTHKINCLPINKNTAEALDLLLHSIKFPKITDYIFKSRNGTNKHITRNRAYVIFAEISKKIDSIEKFSCHSLRKTFGYHAWKSGCSSIILMMLYNHSSFDITKRYLGIEQTEKDEVYHKVLL